MDELASAVRQLDSILKPGLTPEALNSALRKVFQHAKQADQESRDRVLVELAERVASIPLSPASFLAVGCGALVELGADPEQALAPILARTGEALGGATVFAEACQAQARSAPASEDLDPDDAQACIEAYGQQVGDRMPEQADAWLAADHLLRAMTALLSRSAAARAAAASSDQVLVATLERMLGRRCCIAPVRGTPKPRPPRCIRWPRPARRTPRPAAGSLAPRQPARSGRAGGSGRTHAP
jgi:hypothetical protein